MGSRPLYDKLCHHRALVVRCHLRGKHIYLWKKKTIICSVVKRGEGGQRQFPPLKNSPICLLGSKKVICRRPLLSTYRPTCDCRLWSSSTYDRMSEEETTFFELEIWTSIGWSSTIGCDACHAPIVDFISRGKLGKNPPLSFVLVGGGTQECLVP